MTKKGTARAVPFWLLVLATFTLTAVATATAFFAVFSHHTDGKEHSQANNGQNDHIAKVRHRVLLSLAAACLAGYGIFAGFSTVTLAEYQIQQACQHNHSRSRQHTEVCLTGEQATQLINDHRDGIGKATHIGNGAHRPLGVAHLTLDGADGGKARGAQQLEDHEAIGTGSAEIRSDHGPNLVAGLAEFTGIVIQRAEGHNHFFLGDQAGEGSHGSLPAHITHPAQRIEDPGDGIADEGSLRGSSEVVASRIKEEIQEKVSEAGLEIIEARITYLAYAPEIAAVMLQRQQASAIIDARKMIVDGAVGMVEMALERLNENDLVTLDDERKAAMVSNLLVVLCGNHDAQPIVNTGSLY